MITGNSAKLTVLYNIRYTVRITAINCARESAPYLGELFYVDCGTPTTGDHVVVDGLPPARVAQGTNITFRCHSVQAYTLLGPTTAMCNGDGQWQPNTSDVECLANCGEPMASRNVQLHYNSTLEGASVVFNCNEGFLPNNTYTGVCLSDSIWHLNPANLICVNSFGVDCGAPSAPANGIITSQASTLEGARITFKCNTSVVEMYAECMASGKWEPDPTGVNCMTSTEEVQRSDSRKALPYGSAVGLTAVICFISGGVLGMLCLYIILRCKQSHAAKNDQHVESQPPIPVYEDIHTTSCDKPTIELSENVAYGQTEVH